MGQYGNQPDFGTRTRMITPTGSISNPETGEGLGSAALYVGKTGDLLVSVVGGEESGDYGGATLFKEVAVGFFPVIVTNVWQQYNGDDYTTAGDIIAIY